MENLRVDIEIIYDDEILPDDFSLMDIGYCYSWKRVSVVLLTTSEKLQFRHDFKSLQFPSLHSYANIAMIIGIKCWIM